MLGRTATAQPYHLTSEWASAHTDVRHKNDYVRTGVLKIFVLLMRLQTTRIAVFVLPDCPVQLEPASVHSRSKPLPPD